MASRNITSTSDPSETARPKRGAPAKGEPGARERIMATATELFYREGIRAIGVDTVVARSGVSKTSLYRVFKSKDELIAAVAAEQDRLFWVWWDRIVARHPGDPRARFDALLAGIAKRITHRHFRGCPFINLATEFTDKAHPGRAIACANKIETRRRLADLCREIGAAEPEPLAARILLLIDGAFTGGVMTLYADLPTDLVGAAQALLAAQTRT
jgi:AcrR family transcriptional regulator